MKTFWLSFVDDNGFAGVAVIDVTPEMAEDMLVDVWLKFPSALPGSEWIAAATREAHRLGCNPGGEVASMEIPTEHHERFADTPRGVLLQKPELEQLGHFKEEPVH